MRSTQPHQKTTHLNFIGSTVTALAGQSTTLPPKQTENSFNFDLDRMKKAVESESRRLPDTINDFEQFVEWMKAD